MNTKIFITAIVLMFGFTNIDAQTRTDKATKIVLVVNEKTNLVTDLAIYAEIQRLMNTRGTTLIDKKYPNSNFYLGLLKGNYKVASGSIIPGRSATIIMYTNKGILEDRLGNFDKMGDFRQGDVVKLGRSEAAVISKLPVEMTLKVL